VEFATRSSTNGNRRRQRIRPDVQRTKDTISEAVRVVAGRKQQDAWLLPFGWRDMAVSPGTVVSKG
jgi:hypothetical protein